MTAERFYINPDKKKLLGFVRHILDSFDTMERSMALEIQEILRIDCSVSVITDQ